MNNPLNNLKIPKQEESNEKTEIKVSEDINEKPDSIWKKLAYNLTFIFGIGISLALMIFVIKARTPDNLRIIIYFLFSLLANMIIIFLFFWRGVGSEILRRLKNKRLYSTGKYVNTLHFLKTGVVKERFVKIDSLTKSFKMADQPYTTNAKLLLNHKGIPTYIHRQDSPDPVNIWDEPLSVDFSCGELDKVMHSASNFDLKAWIEKNKILAICIFGLMIIGLCFIGFKVNGIATTLQKGTYNIQPFIETVKILCTNQSNVIQQVPITVAGG
ncbi:MAG TPA: hypothetical protein VMQ58_02010 [Candidatus Saccharimonadales bacterium]|nr:hypothetical protein [Candidatus Saccharimonadales bacterium]